MEVVKAFNSNNLHTEIVIKGTINDPLFRASDIGNVLEMGYIRTSIYDFNESVHETSLNDYNSKINPLNKEELRIFLFNLNLL